MAELSQLAAAQYTMRELQGSIIGSSLVVMAIGYSGAMGGLLRFLSPIVVAPTVCMVSRWSADWAAEGVTRNYRGGAYRSLGRLLRFEHIPWSKARPVTEMQK